LATEQQIPCPVVAASARIALPQTGYGGPAQEFRFIRYFNDDGATERMVDLTAKHSAEAEQTSEEHCDAPAAKDPGVDYHPPRSVGGVSQESGTSAAWPKLFTVQGCAGKR
jgi:hypothetical protein